MTKTQKTFLGIGITILALSIVLCIFLDIWFLILKKTAPEKEVASTFKVGLQQTADGDQKPILEIKYFSNENKNGLKMVDFKFNYFLDETQEDFYSQGLQYVGDELTWFSSPTGEIDSNPYKSVKTEQFLWASWKNLYFNAYTRWTPDSRMYNYSSADDYSTTTLSTNPITYNSGFKIQIGDELYIMKFKGKRKVLNEQTFVKTVYGGYTLKAGGVAGLDRNYLSYYAYMDYNYVCKLLLNAVTSLPKGTSQNILFEFGDLFDYYKYNPNKSVYDEVQNSNSDEDTSDLTILGKVFEYCTDTKKISSNIKNYYVIKVTTSADGAQKSSDSLFNCIEGKTNYNNTGTADTDDYFIGKKVQLVTQDDCIPVFDTDNKNVKLKLSEEFKQANYEYRKNIVLKIVIDIDQLDSLGLTFNGLVIDSFADFNVYKVYKLADDTYTEVELC